MYIKGSIVEIQTPTHCNLIARSLTAPPPLLSPSSILPSPSFHCTFIPAWKNSAPFKSVIKFYFLQKIPSSLQ